MKKRAIVADPYSPFLSMSLWQSENSDFVQMTHHAFRTDISRSSKVATERKRVF